MGSKLFKIEPGKEGENRNGDSGTWVKVTETKKLSAADKKF